MKEFRNQSGIILVNSTMEDVVLNSDLMKKEILSTWMSELTSLPPGLRRQVDNPQRERHHASTIAHHAALAFHISQSHSSGEILLSPLSFTTGTADRVSNRVAAQLLESSCLGRSLKHELARFGMYGFIDRLKSESNKTYYRNILHLILAGLCLSMQGIKKAADLQEEVFTAWLSFFREETVSRWKSELWDSQRDVAYQCLREVTHAYARMTGNTQISRLAAQKRSDSGGIYFWEDIKNSPAPHIAPWLALFESWRSLSPAFARRYRQMFMHLVHWLDESFPPDEIADVTVIMAKPSRDPSFAKFLSTRQRQPGAKGKKALAESLRYARRFSEFIVNELALQDIGLRFSHLVVSTDVQEAKNHLKLLGLDSRPSEAKSRPLPMRLYHLTQTILEEGSDGWPGQLTLCKEQIVRESGVEEIYCPVLPTLFLSLFHLPLRVGQLKRFDSGEGDVDRFDGNLLKWEKNTGPNAGYWKRQHESQENRGYAYAFDTKPIITGFSVNTNKTGNPYVVPHQNEKLHRLLYDLRCWQEYNNPCSVPIGPDRYIDGVEDADEGKLDEYPHIFSLFRLPVDSRSGRHHSPPSNPRTNGFWQALMAEVERRWNESNAPDDHIQIVKRQAQTGQPYGAKYNPHGLRVSGITMMLHQKVPIEIVSKLIAGHKTILMTLYYAKPDPLAVHEALEAAAQSREAAIAATCVRELKSAAFEAAQRRTAYIHEDGLRAATAMSKDDRVGWVDIGIGICPWERSRCHDGGPVVRREFRDGSDHSKHAVVEGGPQNCILCRHFWTAPAWRNPLWLYGTQLLRRFAAHSQRVAQLNEEMEVLILGGQAEAIVATREKRLKLERCESEIQNLMAQREIIGKGIWNVQVLLEAFDKVDRQEHIDDSSSSKHQAIISLDATSAVEYVETSDFEQAALLTAGSRIYPMLHDAEAEAARDRFLDKILWLNGMQPLSLTPLTDTAKKRAHDELSSMMLSRLRREELAAVASGSLRLSDVGLEVPASQMIGAAIKPSQRLNGTNPRFLDGPT